MKRWISLLLALALCAALPVALVQGEAAQPADGGVYDLQSGCYDHGQTIDKVILKLSQPVGEATAEDAAQAFRVTVKDYNYNKFGVVFEGDQNRLITGAAVSEDGLTITLDLRYTYATDGVIGGTDYANYGGSYEVALDKPLGDLPQGLVFTYSGVITDPKADVWGAVPPNNEKGEYAYRWFDPAPAYPEMPEGGYPLLVWAYGYGADNKSHVSNRITGWSDPESQEIFGGMYVMIPQVSSRPDDSAEVRAWDAARGMNTILSCIDMIGRDKVNMNRIYIGGSSLGGVGVWQLLTTYPDFFAAAVITCSGGTYTLEQKEALKDVPIYLVHSIDDNAVPVASSLEDYTEFAAVGKQNLYLALFEHVVVDGQPNPAVGHWSWVYAHNDFTGNEEYWADEYTDENGVTFNTTKPGDLGFPSFKHWLAAQSR